MSRARFDTRQKWHPRRGAKAANHRPRPPIHPPSPKYPYAWVVEADPETTDTHLQNTSDWQKSNAHTPSPTDPRACVVGTDPNPTDTHSKSTPDWQKANREFDVIDVV